MKLVDHFKTFLRSEVNLNDTRVSQLGASVEAVQKAIKASGWGPKILDFDAHGSWAHGTIIKPLTGGEFDADLLVIVEPVEGWEAKDYINKLGAFFDGHGTYKDKVHRYSHCVTIEYAGERRIDIGAARDVAGQCQGLAAAVSDAPGSGLGGAQIAVQHGQLCAFLCQSQTGGAADAAATAGDNNGFALQALHTASCVRCGAKKWIGTDANR